MNTIEEVYDIRTAAARILGYARDHEIPGLPEDYYGKTVNDLTEDEQSAVVSCGKDAGLKLYPFKKGTQVLPRVRRVLGFLHSVSFETMLDVGSGRGVFLIPFLNEFPWVSVTSLELLEKRVDFLNDLAAGGFPGLHAECGDICSRPFPDKHFDVITLLEVLEHIPDVEKAVNAAVGMAKKYVVVTVPSKPDSNPEHIHLLTKEKLTRMFRDAGCTRLHFDGVEGHLFMAGIIESGGE